MTWTDRLDELGGHSADVRWRQVWALIARGERMRGKGRDWTRRTLWTLKRASWLVALAADPRTCRACGARIESRHAAALYCTVACRKVAYRRREAKELTPFEAEVARAQEEIAEIRSEMKRGLSALKRWKKAGVWIPPPDFARLDHVPALPDRCASMCADGACPHTDGGLCLYLETAAMFADEDDPPTEEH